MIKKPGKLIVIEGTDGIGKSTQLEALKEHLTKDNIKFATHHFPTYYSYQGKGVEKYLAGEYGAPADLSPYFVNNLYAYDRAITWRVKLKKLYNQGKVILLDRYTTSSIVYQSALMPTKQEKINFFDYAVDFEYNKLGVEQPDLVIFLYAPAELVDKMRNARTENDGNIKGDVHESNLDFLRKVDETAMLAADYFGWTKINCATKDGKKMRSIEDIHAEIYAKVQETTSKNL